VKPVGRASYWEKRYAAAEDGWELGGASPPLGARRGRGVLAPRCGRGHEVRLLAERGFDAVGVDFAPSAVREARALAAATGVGGARFERRDLFALPRSWDGTFDLAFEQTCFCAIDPSRRDDYARALHGLLRPGGLLVGLFYVIRPDEGPPFGTTPAEVRRRFVASGLFVLERARVAAESVAARQGREWLAFLRRAPG
jgi:cyclopropane fatty-acyl-phospholipid synthase-like methyltransferase